MIQLLVNIQYMLQENHFLKVALIFPLSPSTTLLLAQANMTFHSEVYTQNASVLLNAFNTCMQYAMIE